MDESILYFLVILYQLNQYGWIIPMLQRLHLYSVQYLIQLYNGTLFFRNALSPRVQPVAERPSSQSTHGLVYLIFS